MRVFLMHRDRDFEVRPDLRDEIFDAMLSDKPLALASLRRELERRRSKEGRPGSEGAIVQDLELHTLWNAMAGGDEFLWEMAKRVVLSSLTDPDAIIYRQQVLEDCLAHPEVIKEIYELALEAIIGERRRGFLWDGAQPSWILHNSVNLMKLFVDALRRLRELAEERSDQFHSEGFRRLFRMLREELADDYLRGVEEQLEKLELKHGMLESARLDTGDRGTEYVFHEPRQQSWWERLPLGGGAPSFSFQLHPRDEAGARALEEIRGKGINSAADALAQSADHVRSFFIVLRLELAFYLGCVNLHEHLAAKGEPVCFPVPVPAEQHVLSAEDLHDVCLTFHLDDKVVGNDVSADGRALVMITGANQGGKSTLLRGIGLAQLMMQCGMFVGARKFRAATSAGLFTHYKREEDESMEAGKLEEELRRMSEIADRITPRSVLLCNESFASTNEREGSEIARQVIRAMLERRIRVFFVTHIYDLAHSLYEQRLDAALFLRAERKPDGRRTYKLLEGEPLPTSHGEDSYRRIFDSAESGPSEAVAEGGR